MYSVPSRNVGTKQDVRVRQLDNTLYLFEWFWRNAQCISRNRSGERGHRPRVTNWDRSRTDVWYLASWCLSWLLIYSSKNLIGATDRLEYIPVCHQSPSNAKSIYSIPIRNVVRKQNVRVGQFDMYMHPSRTGLILVATILCWRLVVLGFVVLVIAPYLFLKGIS
jgi:hypothetical protein